MRELTKSMMSFSWALSLFGLKQMANLGLPQDMSRPFGQATAGFDAVTRAAGEQLGGTLKSAFDGGDRLQRSMVDMMFGWCSVDVLNPNYWLRMSADVMQRSVQAVGQMVPGGEAAARAAGSAVQSITGAAQSATGCGSVPGTPTGSGGAAPPPGRSL